MGGDARREEPRDRRQPRERRLPQRRLVHPRETAKALILSNSAAAILVHQHPSGSPEPSTEDLALTERLRAVGDLLGIRILDHVILGHDGAFRSLADDGVLGGGR